MFEQYPITTKMHIHSLNGEMHDATIHKKLGDNDYLVEYEGVKCHTIFNPFVGQYYADDKYGIIQDKKQEQCR